MISYAHLTKKLLYCYVKQLCLVRGLKLGVFISNYMCKKETLDRLKGVEIGIFFVQNGVYHAIFGSEILKKDAEFFVLKEDILTRGLSEDKVKENIKVIDYNDLVDLILKYEKLIWM